MFFFYFDTEDKYNPYFVWHLRLDLRMGAGSISTEVHAIFAQMLSLYPENNCVWTKVSDPQNNIIKYD